VVIIDKNIGNPIEKLPDGLENLSQHNLLTYKSLREPLDAWAIEELIGHYVNYRKQISPSLNNLLPVSDFQLYAVSTGYPHKLGKTVTIKKIKEGVYEIQLALHPIRLIVTRRMSKSQQNAIWHLFSGQGDKFTYGNEHYHWHCPDSLAALNQLYDLYHTRRLICLTLGNILGKIFVLKGFLSRNVLKGFLSRKLKNTYPNSSINE